MCREEVSWRGWLVLVLLSQCSMGSMARHRPRQGLYGVRAQGRRRCKRAVTGILAADGVSSMYHVQ